MSAITLQRQPTDRTCVQTCIAMAIGAPVESVVERYGDRPMNQRSLLRALEDVGSLHNPFVFSDWCAHGWHFAVVPSLNRPGGSHQVLIHFNADTFKLMVVDPAQGKTYAEDGSDLVSWGDLIYFIPGGRLWDCEPKQQQGIQ